ncbi:CHAT domain-containing protein [Isoptericola jiangsuensis]|uniref:CHAT domain-containing protein n=1 Tax=Isoptericola jiangsuensis TaxID=548579 RepID=UPI003AAEF851
MASDARTVLARATAATVRGRFSRGGQLFRATIAAATAESAPGAPPDAHLMCRSHLGLALCGYELTGDLRAALVALDEAATWAAADPRTALSFAVCGQRGLLHLRSGDVDSAIAAFEEADAFAADAEGHDRAVMLLNRGSLRLERMEIDAATTDLESCVELATAAQDDLVASKAQHNLGYAHFLRGDLPRALREMDESARRAADRPAAVGLLDKAQVLIEAGLITEAEIRLAQARSLLQRHRSLRDLAEVDLARTRCLVDLQRPAEARLIARRTARRSRALGTETLTARAELAELTALVHIDRAEGVSPRVARARAAAAVELAGSSCWRPADPEPTTARLLGAEWAIMAGDRAWYETLLQGLPRRTRASVADRVHRAAVTAQAAFEDGDRRAGLRAVRRGHAVLAEHRARLGSVDAVASAAIHGARLGVVDVQAALSTGRPAAVFDAVERGRAAFAGAARVRPPQDEELADLLVRARRTAEVARELRAAGESSATRLAVEVRSLQEQARQRSWQLRGSTGELVPRAATTRSVTAALASEAPGAAVVSFLLTECVTAVRVDARGARLVELCPLPEVTELSRRVGHDLEVLANRLIPASMRQVAAASARRALGRLDDVLLAPLEVDGPLYVAARDGLLSLPWSSMPSRAGRATRVHSWVDLRETSPPPNGRGVLVVGGPDVESAEQEAGVVAAEWDDALLLTGADATCAATVAALSSASVVHVAAHGVHVPDNPLFSFVRLCDGPLFAHELDGIDLAGVVVVLSACEVGRAETRVGGEPLGLKSVLLRLGARAVIASVAPLRDDVAARVMPRLHAALAAGVPPSTALASAVAPEPEPVPLVCFGAFGTSTGGGDVPHRGPGRLEVADEMT